MIFGDPDTVTASAAALAGTSALADVATGIDTAAVAALSGWKGETATAAGATFSRFGPALRAGDEACRAVAPVLRGYAAELRAAEEQLAAQPDAAAAAAPVADATYERLHLADEQAARAIDRARELLEAMTVAPPAEATGSPTARPDEADEPGLLNILGHTALDVVGLVPVVGEAADMANAAWYGIDGDYVAAGLSLAAAVPIAGWAFTGGKLGIKGVDTVKVLTDAGGAAAWVKGRPSMVPWNAERVPYKGTGEAYRWIDPTTGKRVKYHAHPPSTDAPPGSNSANGPTYRLQVGNHHLDAVGVRYTAKQLDERSSVYSAQAANDTHIPYPTNQPGGWDGGRRVFVPNATSLADGTGHEGTG